MRWDDFRRSDNVEDRRGDGGGGGFGLPGGGGGLGIGAIVVLGLIGWALGIDPRLLIGGAEMLIRRRTSQHQQQSPAAARRAPARRPIDIGQFVAAVLGSTEDRWKEIFAAGNRTYRAPRLVLFRGGDAIRLRRGAGGDGAVLLPARSAQSISTPRSSPISNAASAAAAARPASSRRPM